MDQVDPTARARGRITLGQFLKREGLALSGGEAKQLIREGLVAVNGAPETRRGRQLEPGDRVAGPWGERAVEAGPD